MGKSEVEKSASSSKSKRERLLFPTKVVIRRLPPSFTEDQLKEELGGFPEHDFLYFVGSDMSFGPLSFSRAYINFKNRDDIIKFRDQFDGYCFVDSRGVEYPAVVEYAPYQGVPKKKAKKDPKVGTILEDPDYLAFIESLKEASEPPPSIESHLEEIEAKKSSSSTTKISTPLLEYMKMKKSSRGRPVSTRGTPEKKRRPEREEPSKSPKKGSTLSMSSNKDAKGTSGQQSPKEEKPKDERKDAKNKDESRRKDELDKKGTRDAKAAPPSKEKFDSKPPPKGKEEKGRPDSGRGYGRRADNRRSDDRRPEDRRASNQRDRRDSTESSGNDRGRDERYRKESGSDSGRRDRRPDSRRDSRPESKPKDREPMSKASNSDKGGKSRKELEREVGSSTKKEKEKKDTESSAVANESKPPAEEARGPPKEEKKRSEAERRVRNKDRPDRAIYQPRSAGRGSPRSDAPKTAEATAEKDKSKESRTKEKSRESERDTRKNRDRDRDRYRDDRRERDRDRRSDRDRDRERPRDKTRDREPVSERVRDTGSLKEERDDKGKGDSESK